MLGNDAMVHINFCFFIVFSLKARRGLQRQNCSLQNSAQASTAWSPTPRSVSHFWIFGKFNCRLCAVLACAESVSDSTVLANFVFSKKFEISSYGS